MNILAALMAGALMAFAAGYARTRLLVVTVRGDSMAPTYADGDRLLAHRTTRRPEIGTVVVFRTPAEFHGRPGEVPALLIKRVVAQDCDSVTVRGDNPVSLDSRHFGAVPLTAIVGHILRESGPVRLLLTGRWPPVAAGSSSPSRSA